MNRTALAGSFVAGIALGAALVWLFADAPEPSRVVAEKTATPASRERRVSLTQAATPSHPAADCPDVDSTTKSLKRERREVAGLKRKLSDRLDALKASQDANPNTGGRGSYELEVCMDAIANLKPDPPAPKRLKSSRPKDFSFDPDLLADFGYPRRDVEWMQGTWEEAKLDKLYLADRLSRGESPEPGMGFVDIELALREDLGDEDYGAMLYATNQLNAVSLSNVMEGSAAYDAGLRGGRVVHSFNGQRVFKPMELQALINATAPDEMFALEIETSNGLDRIWVNRLTGVSFSAVSRAPGRR